jgi:hypothetical protein
LAFAFGCVGVCIWLISTGHPLLVPLPIFVAGLFEWFCLSLPYEARVDGPWPLQ